MFRFRFAALLLAAWLLQQEARAQSTEGTDQSVLPEVEVTPPVDEPVAEVDSPPTRNFARPTYSNDTSFNYPDLAQLTLGDGGAFGTTTGVLRSGTSLFDTPRAASIVTRQEIAEKQAPDMFHALQNEVGVMMQSTARGQAAPYIRGLTGQQVLILVDGIRLNNSVTRFGPNQYFNTIDPGMVDHIEVLRGAGSVLWGSDAIGGVINVVTRSPDVRYGMLYGDYSTDQFIQYYNTSDSAPYTRMNVEGWIGNGGIFAGGSYLDVHDLDTGFDFGRQPGTNYDQYAGDVKMNFLLSPSELLTVSLQHLEQDEVPRSDRFPGFPGDRNNSNTFVDARFFDPQQRDLAYFRYQATDPFQWSDAISLTASYNRQKEAQTRGVPLNRIQEIDVESTGLTMLSAKDLGNSGKLTAGVDWYHDDIDSPFSLTATAPIIPDDAFYERLGTFLNWEVPLTYDLSAVAGVRYELIDTAGTPRVQVNGVPTPIFISPHYEDWVAHGGLVYQVEPGLHLVGSISEGFRAPNVDDLMANNPNVLQQGTDLPSIDLTPEHSVTYEIGAKTNYDALRTQAFVYWTEIEDAIVPIVAGANQFAFDNQEASIQGVEMDGELLLDSEWSLYGNFWYTYGVNEFTDAPLSRIPPMQGNLGLRWYETRLRSYFTTYVWMVDRQDRIDPVRDAADERIPLGGTPGFATLNVRMGRTFGDEDQHLLSLSLENLTDKAYLVHGSGVFGTGFTARFGYTWTR